MSITSYQSIFFLSPLLIIGLTVVILLFYITWRKNEFISFILTLSGLILSFFSVYFIWNTKRIDITPLLRIDSYSVFCIALIILSSIIVCVFSSLDLSKSSKDKFYLLLLIITIGAILLPFSNHFSLLFISIELLSVPLFGMIAYNAEKRISLEAAVKYTILSAVASSFLLFSIALIYSDLGTLNFIKIGQLLGGNFSQHPLFIVAFGMFLVCFAFKLSLVPFHLWTPDVYQGAPTSVSCFLATVSKISIFSVITRFFMDVSITTNKAVCFLLAIIAAFSIIFGSVLAIFQTNIKRFLGYSSIANIGYLFASLITIKNNSFSLEATEFYLFSYILTTLGIFGVVSVLSHSSFFNFKNADLISLYRGLFWRNPILSSILMIMLLSSAGLPLTIGFIGKFYIIISSVDSDLWFLTFSIILGSCISIYYYFRIAINLYLPDFSSKLLSFSLNSNVEFQYVNIIIVIMLGLSFLVFLFGIYPQPFINFIQIINSFM